MSEEVFVFFLLVVVMLVGSYLAGIIPLVMQLNEEKLQFVTVLGAGLLVGTALAVIIPEGIKSLYIQTGPCTPQGSEHADHSQHLPSAETISALPICGSEDHTKAIGLSLVLGFVFMMLVDQISQQKTGNKKSITATLGLVVHAAADGVALGAAATTSHQDVEFIVFLAIMLHKAPAAFGLVSFLLHEKVDRQRIRKHLLIFSLSAPLLTLLTYFGIGQEQKETLNSINATGIAMLFSAGTFLYVATVHVLPELIHGGGSGHSHGGTSHVQYRVLEDPDNHVESIQPSLNNSAKGLRLSELITMVCGVLLPLILTLGHDHH